MARIGRRGTGGSEPRRFPVVTRCGQSDTSCVLQLLFRHRHDEPHRYSFLQVKHTKFGGRMSPPLMCSHVGASPWITLWGYCRLEYMSVVMRRAPPGSVLCGVCCETWGVVTQGDGWRDLLVSCTSAWSRWRGSSKNWLYMLGGAGRDQKEPFRLNAQKHENIILKSLKFFKMILGSGRSGSNPESGGPRGGGPTGLGPEGWARRVGPKGGAPHFALFFPSPATIFILSSLLGVFSWNFGERRDPQMCTFGVLGLSCETPAAPRPKFRAVRRRRSAAEGSSGGGGKTVGVPRRGVQQRGSLGGGSDGGGVPTKGGPGEGRPAEGGRAVDGPGERGSGAPIKKRSHLTLTSEKWPEQPNL